LINKGIATRKEWLFYFYSGTDNLLTNYVLTNPKIGI